MPRLLHLDSSADPVASTSRAITAEFAHAWRSLGDDHTVTHRDLHADPLPHLADASLHWAPALRRPDETAPPVAEARQRELLDELTAADVLLVGAPMYNWSLPSSLKAWIDHIHVLGVTAPFGELAAQPMAGRSAVVVVSEGAFYGEGAPIPDGDHVTPVLQAVLGRALGMTVTPVVTSCTLADRVGAMAALRPRADGEREAALVRMRELAARLG